MCQVSIISSCAGSLHFESLGYRAEPTNNITTTLKQRQILQTTEWLGLLKRLTDWLTNWLACRMTHDPLTGFLMNWPTNTTRCWYTFKLTQVVADWWKRETPRITNTNFRDSVLYVLLDVVVSLLSVATINNAQEGYSAFTHTHINIVDSLCCTFISAFY